MNDVLERVTPKTCEHALRIIQRNPGILVVDDLGLILTLLKSALEPRGFSVWLALDGDDALDLYRRNREEIDLVLLDVQMPDLDGPQTLVALRKLNPNVLACFMTGNSGVYSRDDLLKRGAARVFDKPFLATELAARLHELLKSANPGSQRSRSSRPRRRPHAINATD